MPDVTFTLEQKGSESALCLYSGCHSVYVPDVILVSKKNVKVHCVYIPDAILSIFRMSLLLNKSRESALCLYSGCHSAYMPDIVFA